MIYLTPFGVFFMCYVNKKEMFFEKYIIGGGNMETILKNGQLKLVKIKIYNSYSDDRIVLKEIKDKCPIGLAVLYEVRNDFLDNDDEIYSDYDSYQVRPKALYKDSKGIFVKAEKKTYLDREYLDWLRSAYPEYAELLKIEK